MSKRNRNSNISSQMTKKNKWIAFGGGLLVVVALGAFVVFRSNRAEPVAAAPSKATPAAAAPAGDHDHGAEASVRRITAVELREAIDSGQAAVIDVRDLDSYAAGHIAGAMHIPLSFIESQVPYLPRDKMLVTYCT